MSPEKNRTLKGLGARAGGAILRGIEAISSPRETSSSSVALLLARCASTLRAFPVVDQVELSGVAAS